MPAGTVVRRRVPFSRVQIDLVGPISPPSHGYRYIFCMVCPMTRWAVLQPMRRKTAKETARALLHCLLDIGVFPPIIQCDRGREFLNRTIDELLGMIGSSLTANPSYTPRLLGINEGSHKVLAASLTCALHEYVQGQLEAWADYLPAAQHVLRGQPLGGTHITPYDLIHAWRHSHPGSVTDQHPWTELPVAALTDGELREWCVHLKQVSSVVYGAYNREMDRYERHMKDASWRPKSSGVFEVGDLVFLARPPREEGVSPVLLERADGPYRVVDIQGQRATLEAVDGSEVAFEQPVSTARLIRFPWAQQPEGSETEKVGEPAESDSDFGDDNSPGAE